MTPVQEADINNVLLTLMYEWKTGMIDQAQALKEFKQCLKYYSRMEDVVRFEDNELIDERRIEHYGIEKTIQHCKQALSERIAKKAIERDCFYFEEIEREPQNNYPGNPTYRHFRMKMEAIIQKQTP